MSIEDNEVEIWTRLLIGFEDGNVLEIYSALDENGIEFHQKGVSGEKRKSNKRQQRTNLRANICACHYTPFYAQNGSALAYPCVRRYAPQRISCNTQRRNSQ